MNTRKLISLLLAGLLLCGCAPVAPQTTSAPTTAAPAETTLSTTAPTTMATETTAPTYPLPPAVMPEDYALTATHAFVYDCGSETMRFTLGDQDQPLSPASLTKLMTIYTAMQHMSPDTVVTAGEEVTWVDPASSLATVEIGDQLSVELLIEGMLLQSGNDAAYALAVAGGRVIAEDPQLSARQALDVFMKEVNAQVAALGLRDTFFVTPDGMDAPGHHSTPADMLLLTRKLMEYPMVLSYAGTSRAMVTFENGKILEWLNTNYLLHPESPYFSTEACGLKTGYTSKAGACMIALFYTGGRYLIVGIFGAPKYEDRAADALYLYEQYRG